MSDTERTKERLTVTFECLSRSRRRTILDRSNEAEKPVALADLANDVADREIETPGADSDDETVEGVHRSLYHVHVPKLAAADLVRHEQERGTVKHLDSPEELRLGEQLLTGG